MGSSAPEDVDYRAIYRASVDAYLILAADPPNYTIVDMSDEYARVTGADRERALGEPLFEAFPEGTSNGTERIRQSLETVLREGRPDSIGAFRFDLPYPDEPDAEPRPRYWSPLNIPIFDDDGEITHVVNRVHEITEFILREQHRPLLEEEEPREVRI